MSTLQASICYRITRFTPRSHTHFFSTVRQAKVITNTRLANNLQADFHQNSYFPVLAWARAKLEQEKPQAIAARHTLPWAPVRPVPHESQARVTRPTSPTRVSSAYISVQFLLIKDKQNPLTKQFQVQVYVWQLFLKVCAICSAE